MQIFSIALSPHDQNTYDGKVHRQEERYSRLKHNIPYHMDVYEHHSELERMNQDDGGAMHKFYDTYWKPEMHDILAFTTTRGGMKLLPDNHDISQDFLDFKPTKLWDFYQKENLYYIDHHQSHAAYAFLTSNFKKSDILAIDGRGWHFNCIFVDKDENIIDLSDKMGLGILWNWFAKQLGFGHLGAGKLMGLAGYGKYSFQIHLALDHYFENNFEFPKDFEKMLDRYPIETIAATLQYATLEMIEQHVVPLKTSNNICVAGGVAYNGYMNEMLTKHWKKVHIPPAVGDEGQSLGTYMHADYILNNKKHKLTVYNGDEYEYNGIEKVDLQEIAMIIANGGIVGWYQGKSESGNRALGNRSILADPRDPDIKDKINAFIKQREDFRPFAPTVLEEHYKEWFDTNQPSPYMSRIMPVLPYARDKIPGVTHVDGTARIQTLNRKQNPRYYDLIEEFHKLTGVPMLLNTSFNCKEPIVETPENAIATFKKTELDVLVINDYIVRKVGR
jgi:carbamoyltransferase